MSGGGLVRSSSVMVVGTVASRLLGFVRSIVIATAIGTALVGTTYSVANTVPNIVYLLLIGGVINSVFVPQLVRSAKEDPDGGQAYTDRLLTLTALCLLVITVVATLAAPLLIDAYASTGWSSRDKAVAVAFAYWCLPQILFYGVYTMLGQVLNSRRSFGPMMWAPVANNIVVIAMALAFLVFGSVDVVDTDSLSTGEIAFLGAGTTIGVVVQALVLLPALRAAGYRYRPRFDFRGHGLGHALSLAKWTIGFVLVNQASYVVVTQLATGVDSAAKEAGIDYGVGYNAYQNAYLFFMLPHSVITVSVVTAMLPAMSGAAADGRVGEVRRQLSQGLRLIGTALVPAAALLVLVGPVVTTVLFSVGDNLTTDAGAYIGLLVATFALGLIPFSAHHVLLRAFYAYEDTRTPFKIACIVTVTNIVLALAVVPALPVRWKTVGLAGAYAATYWIALAVTAASARRRLDGIDGARVVRTYVRLVLAVLVAAAAGAAVLVALRWAIGSALPAAVVQTLAVTVVLVAVFALAARRMRVSELDQLLGSLPGGRRGRPQGRGRHRR
ncbi:murein biosynthesis integral membrane protein MurJ [Motilibacter aurantiacus]|uniref:murein biosynthesis integral membrane protein MurJ n=1 Tax=Motilibacter aurantiacus TaxID=2714955 RepID=UPI001409030A|nr:murein biosynthesis integral membrane protein MurJ [Motilibacter aurantiacus]